MREGLSRGLYCTILYELLPLYFSLGFELDISKGVALRGSTTMRRSEMSRLLPTSLDLVASSESSSPVRVCDGRHIKGFWLATVQLGQKLRRSSAELASGKWSRANHNNTECKGLMEVHLLCSREYIIDSYDNMDMTCRPYALWLASTTISFFPKAPRFSKMFTTARLCPTVLRLPFEAMTLSMSFVCD